MRNVPAVRGLLLAATIALHLGAADHNGLAEKLHVDFNVPLWADGHVPGAAGDWAVDKPYLTAVLPPEGKGNGAAVIICPGGGNTTLFVHQEGMAIAEHLNSWGVAGFILTYRLNPRYQQDARDLDGRRAVQLLRARSADFKIDQNRIGMMGLSAGSLARWVPERRRATRVPAMRLTAPPRGWISQSWFMAPAAARPPSRSRIFRPRLLLRRLRIRLRWPPANSSSISARPGFPQRCTFIRRAATGLAPPMATRFYRTGWAAVKIG